MNLHPATTKVIKQGKSKAPFLLFFGNRNREENVHLKSHPDKLTTLLLALVVIILVICIYAFFSGKLA